MKTFFCVVIALFILFASGCTKVAKRASSLNPLVNCINGATNYPACDTCPTGQHMNANIICEDDNILDCINGLGKKIAWDAYTDSADGFKLYRSPDDNNFTMIKEGINIGFTEFDILDGNDHLTVTLYPCVPNYLYITAYNSSLESDPSNHVCWGMDCP